MYCEWNVLRELRKSWTLARSRASGVLRHPGVPHPDCSCGFEGPGKPDMCVAHHELDSRDFVCRVWSSGLETWEHCVEDGVIVAGFVGQKRFDGKLHAVYTDVLGRFVAYELEDQSQ